MDDRDVFAAIALAGMLAHSRGEFEAYATAEPDEEGVVGRMYGRMFGYRSKLDWHVAIAEEAYELADCMLAARILEGEDRECAG